MGKQLVGSVVLATCVVAAGVWVADSSLKPRLTDRAANAKELQPLGSVDSQPTRSARPQSPDDLAGPMVSGTSASSAGIYKCVLAGKTVYSSGGCPDGAKSQAVVIHDSAGIVSPPKEHLADLTAKRQAAERAYALQAQAQVTAIGRSNRVECEELDRRVAELDAMARQPNSGPMQDWLRIERKAVRDRQFALRC